MLEAVALAFASVAVGCTAVVAVVRKCLGSAGPCSVVVKQQFDLVMKCCLVPGNSLES